MALDRQTIERKDFPIGRRGYDPDAVDAHLSALAAEVDELRRSSRRRNESLAAAASEQVRSIVEAAETSAAEIQRQAEAEAVDIRSEADTDARATREHATSQAREYVGNVSQSTKTMLERLEAMQSELGALFDGLRTGGNRLNADLQLLETNLDAVRDAVAPRPRFEPEPPTSARPHESAPSPSSAAPPSPAPAPVPEPEPAPAPAAIVDDHAEAEPESRKNQGDALAEAQAAPTAEPVNGTDDSEGARLVALNMALNGTPREETERYLAENFRLTDRRGLLDDVYAAVEG